MSKNGFNKIDENVHSEMFDSAKKGWFQGELLTSSPTQFEPFSDAA